MIIVEKSVAGEWSPTGDASVYQFLKAVRAEMDVLQGGFTDMTDLRAKYANALADLVDLRTKYALANADLVDARSKIATAITQHNALDTAVNAGAAQASALAATAGSGTLAATAGSGTLAAAAATTAPTKLWTTES